MDARTATDVPSFGAWQTPEASAAASTPVLYSFRRCPYAMRARMALQAAGVEVELREIVLKAKPVELLQVSPKGTVPVLVLPFGRVIEQSLDIMLWVLQQSDPQRWLPTNQAAMDDMLANIALNDGPFKQALDRYKYPARFGLADGLGYREQGAALLQQWEVRLTAQPCLSGARWGLLDAAIAPFVRQFAHTDPDWFAAQHWPQLQRWLAGFEASAAFAAAMHKVPAWQAGDAPRTTRFAT
jgi:glutathione S-transferase